LLFPLQPHSISPTKSFRSPPKSPLAHQRISTLLQPFNPNKPLHQQPCPSPSFPTSLDEPSLPPRPSRGPSRLPHPLRWPRRSLLRFISSLASPSPERALVARRASGERPSSPPPSPLVSRLATFLFRRTAIGRLSRLGSVGFPYLAP
jgi:hypothetical protein